jgi:histone H2A
MPKPKMPRRPEGKINLLALHERMEAIELAKEAAGEGGSPGGPGGKGGKKPEKTKRRRRRTLESRLPKDKFRGFSHATGFGRKSNKSTGKPWSETDAGIKMIARIEAVTKFRRATIKARRGAKPPKPVSTSLRAGLLFPVSQMHIGLKERGGRVGVAAAIYTAAVIEYLVAEVIELSGNACKDISSGSRIHPKHIMLAISNDDDLNPFCRGAPGRPYAGELVIRGAGAQDPPMIHKVLFEKGKKK